MSVMRRPLLSAHKRSYRCGVDSDSGHSPLKLASFLVTRGLAVPAILFLEMQKPLCGLVHVAGEAALPLLGVFLGRAQSRELLDLCGSRERIEALICEIEAAEERR